MSVKFILFLIMIPVFLVGCTSQFVAQGGWSGVALGIDTLYVGSKDGRLLAINSETGLIQWSFPAEDAEELGPIYGTPILENGHVYFGAYNGKVYSVNPPTETPSNLGSWEFDTLGHIVGGVAATEDMVLVGSSDGRLYALDMETGMQRWSFLTNGMIWSTPTIVEGIIYFGSMDRNVYALRLDGTEVWRFAADGAVVSGVRVEGNKAYVGTFDRHLYALDVSTGSTVWDFAGAENWFWATPEVHGNYVYAGNMDGFLYAVNSISGVLQWRFDTGGALLVPPVIDDDGILIASDSGRIWFLNWDGQERFAPGFYDVGASIRAPMTRQNDIVYLNAMNNTVTAVDAHRANRVWSSSTEGR